MRFRTLVAIASSTFAAVLACGAPATGSEGPAEATAGAERAAPADDRDGRARRPPAADPPPADPAADPALPPFAREILAAHNRVRAEARPTPRPALDPLVWDPELAAFAQRWVNRCPSGHNPRASYGENMYFSSTSSEAAERAVAGWASEASYYDARTGQCSRDGNRSWAHCGHYTQVVWRDTARVGCAIQTSCPGRFSTIVVCNYDPPGNVNVSDTAIPAPY